MRGQDLLDKMELVDAAFVEEAEQIRRRPWLRILTAAACLCLVITACLWKLPEEKSTIEMDISVDTNNEAEQQPSETEPTQMEVIIDGLLEIKTEDDLFRQSSLIVYGTVTGKTDAFQVEYIGGQRRIFTDCTVAVSECYRGEPVDAPITVRVHGGVFGDINEVHSNGAKLEAGEDYLLFLYQPGYGLTNTAGSYYYVLGLAQGVFRQQDGGSYLSQLGNELKAETLTERATEYPVDPDYCRNEFIENQKGNLENGMISQEEYDRIMAQMDEYAIIITEENG